MKFEKIYINGFGALQELGLDNISPGLNIIEGANEAGKTTMLEFVRALFFGFAQRDKSNDDARRYEPKGGVHGGWAILQNSHKERLRIDRIGDKTSAGDCRVQLLGTDRDINIDVLLSGADRVLYEQIFAFSLDELTDFSQSDQRVQDRIYAASSGRGSDSLFSALKRTDDAAKGIYTKRGRSQSLHLAFVEYQKLQSQIDELSGQVEDYNSDHDQLLAHQQDLERLREEFVSIKKQLDKATLHADVWEAWVQLVLLRKELAELPAQTEFDETAASVMADLKITLQQQQDAIEEKQPRLKRVEEELEECQVDGAILRNAGSIKSVKDQLGTYESTLRALPLDEQKLESAQKQVKVLLEQLGPRWNEENVQKIDTSREPRLQIHQWEKTLQEQEATLNDAIQKESATAQQATQQERSLHRLREELQKEFPVAPPRQEELKQRAEALREADLLLRKLGSCELRAESLRKEVAPNQSQQGKDDIYSSSTLLPSWAIFTPLALAILAGTILLSQPILAMVIAGLFVIVTVVLFVLSRSQSTAQAQREENEKQRQQHLTETIAELESQLQHCHAEIEAANSQLQSIAKKWNWKLQTQIHYQQHFEKLEDDRIKRLRYEYLQANIKQRSDDLDAIQEIQKSQNEDIEFHKSTFVARQKEWKEWLAARLLPAEALPRQALDLFDFVEKVRAGLHDCNLHQLEIAAKEKQCRDFEDATSELCDELQYEMPKRNLLPGAVRAWSDALEKQQRLDIQRKNLSGNQQQLQDEIETQSKRLQETTQKIDRILSDTCCADQAEFDTKMQIARQREELCKLCQAKEAILASHSAPGEARRKLENDLKKLDAQSVKDQLELARAAYAEVEEEKSKAERAQGEWNNRIKQREQDEGKLTALLRQLEIQKSTIAELTQRWMVARLSNALLDCTRERFEQERQPAVIKRAGELMRDVTDGRYQSVLATRGLNAVELDEGERGRKPLSRWSRGTKEQFYLALRLAFIEDYCSQTHLEPLPVVMDDVLVHSDGYNRLSAASAMIAQFAEKYQVLYFTCRPGDAKVLSSASPSAKRFRLQEKTIVAL